MFKTLIVLKRGENNRQLGNPWTTHGSYVAVWYWFSQRRKGGEITQKHGLVWNMVMSYIYRPWMNHVLSCMKHVKPRLSHEPPGHCPRIIQESSTVDYVTPPVCPSGEAVVWGLMAPPWRITPDISCLPPHAHRIHLISRGPGIRLNRLRRCWQM